jgi:hypothetical protein
MWRFLRAKQFENVQVLMAGKKNRQSQFQKFVKESNVENEKSAWTGLGIVKKGLFSGKCL